MFSILPADITAMLAYVGQLWTDTLPIVALAIGLPLAFYVINKVISLVRSRTR